MLSVRRILVLAPHADDESLGCAGWLGSLKDQPEVEVKIDLVTSSYVDLHQGRRSLPGYKSDQVTSKIAGMDRVAEFHQACDVMGVKQRTCYGLPTRYVAVPDLIPKIEESINQFRPDTVVFPGLSFHQDHQSVFRATMSALRPRNSPTVKNVLCYEVTNYAWQAPGEEFIPNLYCELTAEQLALKQQACAVYVTQRLNTEGGQEEVRRLAVQRGAQMSPLPQWVTPTSHDLTTPLAEAYKLIRARF